VKNALAALNPAYSAGERLLRSAVNHFDRILTQREFQSLMQQEMVRFRHGNAGSLPLFFRTAFKPLIEKLQQAVTEVSVPANSVKRTRFRSCIPCSAQMFLFLERAADAVGASFQAF